MSKVNKLGQYRKIEVNAKRKEVTEEELNQQIQMLLAQNPILEEKDGEVESGDVTIIDFEGFKDGVAFEGGKAENYQLEIGSGAFIPGFEDQMIGMKKGETRELNLTFPKNYGAADLAGADVIFKVTVHKIGVKKEAELNDDFVAGLNAPQIGNVDDLKNALKTNIQSQHDQEYRSQVENAVFEKLINNSEVEISNEDLDRALQQQIQHIEFELSKQQATLDQYLQMMGMTKDGLLKQLEPNAKQQATFEAIIDEIVRVENITASDEEANEQIKIMAKQNNLTKEQVLEKVELEGIKRDLGRIKASQVILQTAIINE